MFAISPQNPHHSYVVITEEQSARPFFCVAEMILNPRFPGLMLLAIVFPSGVTAGNMPTNAEQCEAIADQHAELTYSTSATWYNRPPGCWVNSYNDILFWNTAITSSYSCDSTFPCICSDGTTLTTGTRDDCNPAPSPLPTVSSPVPTLQPSSAPTALPSLEPTLQPSSAPTAPPTGQPSLEPTAVPTLEPSPAPSLQPTLLPSLAPTLRPTSAPSLAPSLQPTLLPTALPTVVPIPAPTRLPMSKPSAVPSSPPTGIDTTDDNDDDGASSAGIMIGAGVGGLLLIGVVVFWMFKKQHTKSSKKTRETVEMTAIVESGSAADDEEDGKAQGEARTPEQITISVETTDL